MTKGEKGVYAKVRKKNADAIRFIFHTMRFAGYQILQKLQNIKKTDDLVSLKQASVIVAFICDEMTWSSFSPLCNAVYVTPYNARYVVEHYHPSFLFCESCWHGVKPYAEVWRSRIYRNHYILYDNRAALFKTLELFRSRGIPTVFWDKEDPAYFHSFNYDFVSTALKFDYVFSTSAECMEFYKKKGHVRSQLLPFGFSPEIFNPLQRSGTRSSAIFAGSWYPEHSQRCIDFRKICACLLKSGIQVDVYDRNYKTGRTNFPKDLSLHVYPAIPYRELGGKYRSAGIGIVLNTVTNSETMFARRFVEMAACGIALISNESQSLRRLFPDGVFFADGKTAYQPPMPEAVHNNLRTVFLNHTVQIRWNFLLSALGISSPSKQRILVFTNLEFVQRNSISSAIQIFARDKLMQIKPQEGDLGIVLTQGDIVEEELLFWQTQFVFLPQPCAVGRTGERYQLSPCKRCDNLLMPLNILQGMEDGSIKCVQAYCA